jgi:ribA/ribD-fused uncharacterized protein
MSNPQEPSLEGPIYFYPPEYYVFDNFSSFQIEYKGKTYPTSEHAFQSTQFIHSHPELAEVIRNAKSAHDAQEIARENKEKRDPSWEDKKLNVMKEILLCKVAQHPYVKKKLLQSGGREIIEDSWRDNYWGWGKEKNGENMLGKLWCEVREIVKAEEI